MQPDLLSLYKQMLRSRLFEEAVAHLWTQGLISGEMHLGTGEEAIIAGVVDHLRDGDGMALDHRGTAAMMMRGVEPVLLLGRRMDCVLAWAGICTCIPRSTWQLHRGSWEPLDQRGLVLHWRLKPFARVRWQWLSLVKGRPIREC